MMAQSRKLKLSSHPLQPGKENEAEVDNSQRRIAFENGLKYLEDHLERRLYGERQRLLLDVANLRGQDAVSWFWKKWLWLWPETPKDLIELRDELQEVWRSDRELSERAASGFRHLEHITAASVATAPPPPDYLLNKWLSWRPSAEQEESRKSLSRDRFLAIADKADVRDLIGEWFGFPVDSSTIPSAQRWWSVVAPFTCSLHSRRLVPEPRNLRAMLVQGVLEHWGRLKYCANTHCLSPYFIARRNDQTVCDAEICKAEKQREHARKWWNENRAKNAPKETKTGSNAAKKGRRENVTRKAR